MENASARNLWGDFLDAHLEFASEDAPKVIHFCDNEKDADTCADLVCKDIKRATSHSLLGMQYRQETLPKIGDFSVVTDWAGKAKCVIRTTSVKLVPYFAIHAEHARLEGEGDKSLEHWQKSHWDYYTRELSEFNRTPRESMIVVFERFEKVYQR
ncbi:ASCH domain-containing protein [Muricauda sp. 2012CJ35-5]|uniref:ASCH domain-containing protein n=1 Tax=Flagellimonas spongiicola TaxID=2942208 RepID=A0ABT0PTA8_9FLAO|nr:ASCH domain-containing protein [Allomuricauda spongiicola]MCL6274446.1 ASCH domain-containing protein [Allomuricauda spongiicola]